MKRWTVTSPYYEYTEVVYMGDGPKYDTCSYAEVVAPTKRAAKVRAVRIWRGKAPFIEPDLDFVGDLRYCDGGRTNPFKGLHVEEVKPCPFHVYEFLRCEYGRCIPYDCDICDTKIPIGTEVIYDMAPEEAGGNTYAHPLCMLPEEEHARAVFGDEYQ